MVPVDLLMSWAVNVLASTSPVVVKSRSMLD